MEISEGTWKRVAKLYRRRFRVVMDTLKLANYANDLAKDCYELSQARADSRLELLREILEMEACPFCWANQEQEHAANCQLAKELSDD